MLRPAHEPSKPLTADAARSPVAPARNSCGS